MDYKHEMKEIFKEQKHIALATAVDNRPNVRILVFCTDEKCEGLLYFGTFLGNNKIKEFENNDKVSFTTIPSDGSRHVRVRDAVVKKSDLSVKDLKDKLCEKFPGYADLIEQVGESMVLYEVHFSMAEVAVDMENVGEVTL